MREAATSAGLPIVPPPAHACVERQFLGQSDRLRLSSAASEVPLVHRALKIKPSNAFITKVVRDNGEAILVLGTRKAESASRSHAMTRLERERVAESESERQPSELTRLHADRKLVQRRCVVVPDAGRKPLGLRQQGTVDDVPERLQTGSARWSSIQPLRAVGTAVLGAGSARWWTRIGSMHAMIQNDKEKEWMMPLLQLRNELDVADNRPLRDFRRRSFPLRLLRTKVFPL